MKIKTFKTLPLNFTFFLFCSLLLLAIAIRFYKFGSVPKATYWDETAILADAKSVAETGKDIHGNHWLQPIFPSYGDYKLPVYIWLTTLSVKLLGVSSLSLRVPALITGLMTITLSSLLTVSLFKQKGKKAWWLALAVASTVALSPWAFHFSRVAFEAHVGQLLLLASVYLCSLALNHQKIYPFFLAQFIAALATYSYYSVRFVWPVILLSLVTLYFFSSKLPIKKKLLNSVLILFSLALYLLLLIPMTNSPIYQEMNQLRLSTTSIFNLKDYALESNVLREQAGNTFLSRLFYHRHWLMIKELLKNYSDYLSLSTLFFQGDQNLRHSTSQHGLFLLPMAPLFFIGLISLWKKHRSNFLLLNIWWLVAILPAAVADETPHALRSLNALAPLSIIIGFGLYQLLSWLKDKTIWLQLSLFVLILVPTLSYWHFYFNVYPSLSELDWQYGFTPAAEKICELNNDFNQVWVDLDDHRFFIWVLAYCDYRSNSDETAMFEGYNLKRIDNILFNRFGWEDFQVKGDDNLYVTGKVPNNNDTQTQPNLTLDYGLDDKYYFYWNL